MPYTNTREGRRALLNELYRGGADGEVLSRDSTLDAGVAWVAGGGGGGGDNITVNGVAVTNADFDSATPAAPTNGRNVVFQKDASSPANISAHVLGDGDATHYLDGTGSFSTPAGLTHPQAMARGWF